MSQKVDRRASHTFTQYWPIFEILSPAHSSQNMQFKDN